jgi:hypothetical protein
MEVTRVATRVVSSAPRKTESQSAVRMMALREVLRSVDKGGSGLDCPVANSGVRSLSDMMREERCSVQSTRLFRSTAAIQQRQRQGALVSQTDRHCRETRNS